MPHAISLRALALFAIVQGVSACDYLSPEVGGSATSCSEADAGAPSERDAGVVLFARDIRPIMDRKRDDPRGSGCASCHYSTASFPIGIELGGLDMTTLGSLRRGGNTSKGSVVVPGKPCASAIVQKLRGTYFFGDRMPRNLPPLRDEEIQLFADWIAQGAKGADNE